MPGQLQEHVRLLAHIDGPGSGGGGGGMDVQSAAFSFLIQSGPPAHVHVIPTFRASLLIAQLIHLEYLFLLNFKATGIF